MKEDLGRWSRRRFLRTTGAVALLGSLGILPAIVINLALALIIGAAFLTLIHRVNGALEAYAERDEEAPAEPKTPPPGNQPPA